jgi:hypothetical protein
VKNKKVLGWRNNFHKHEIAGVSLIMKVKEVIRVLEKGMAI